MIMKHSVNSVFEQPEKYTGQFNLLRTLHTSFETLVPKFVLPRGLLRPARHRVDGDGSKKYSKIKKKQ